MKLAQMLTSTGKSKINVVQLDPVHQPDLMVRTQSRKMGKKFTELWTPDQSIELVSYQNSSRKMYRLVSNDVDFGRFTKKDYKTLQNYIKNHDYSNNPQSGSISSSPNLKDSQRSDIILYSPHTVDVRPSSVEEPRIIDLEKRLLDVQSESEFIEVFRQLDIKLTIEEQSDCAVRRGLAALKRESISAALEQRQIAFEQQEIALGQQRIRERIDKERPFIASVEESHRTANELLERLKNR